MDKLEINKEVTASINEEENSIRNINNSINTSTKKHKQKINFKWNKDNNNKYMMNLKEITRNLAGYHEKVMSNKTTKDINKFISGSNQKEERKSTKNKRRVVHSFDKKEIKNDKKMRLSSEINKISRFEFNKESDSEKENIENIKENKSYILYDEEIDDEIKELEIEEQNILDIINKINNLENA